MSTGSNMLERLPPQAIDVERSVLGSMINDASAAETAISLLPGKEVFYQTSNKIIYAAICSMIEKNVPVDLITLKDELSTLGSLEAVGGTPYLSELCYSVATTANITPYCEILVDKHTKRSLISLASEIHKQCFDDQYPANEILETAQTKTLEVKGPGVSQKTYRKFQEILPDVFAEIEGYSSGKGGGLKTGFTLLDESTGGLFPGDLIYLAGRPSIGKTSIATQIAINVAKQYRRPVVQFSLEMRQSQNAMRVLCTEAKISINSLRTGSLPRKEYPRLSMAAGVLSDIPYYIDDEPACNPLHVLGVSRAVKRAEGDLALIVVDYMQLMSSGKREESRQLEVSSISSSLKQMAMKMGVPVIGVSQLSRKVEDRGGDKRPQLSDLRESGSLENDADTVLLVYRGEYYFPEDESMKNKAEIIVAKQRNGPVGTIPLFCDMSTTFFGNLAPDGSAPADAWYSQY